MPIRRDLSSKLVYESWIAGGVPLLLGVLILVQTSSFRKAKSPTFDETFFLNTALSSVELGTLDPRISGEGVAPVPILLTWFPVAWFAGGSLREEVWQGELEDPPLVDQARLLNACLVGVPTMLLVYCWLLRRRGLMAALLGAALVTFSPTMLAHFSVATTDACFTLMVLLALLVLTGYWKSPTRHKLIGLAAAVSLAISAKYSGIFLIPCVLIVMILVTVSQRETDRQHRFWDFGKRLSRSLILFLVLLVPFTWAFHLFGFTGPLKTVPYAETPDSSAWVRVLGRGPLAQQIMEVSHTDLKRPAPFAGILFQFLHNAAGHDAYLMGQHSRTGWWYYFPLAWLWKSTPAELLLTCLALILIPLLLSDVWHARLSMRNSPTEETDQKHQASAPTFHAPLVWLLAIIILLSMSLTSRLNLGQRYLLPIYPLLCLLTIDQLSWRLRQRKAVFNTFASLCIGLQLIAVTSIQPHYLAYFNPLAGGPAEGHHYLLDSNLDWGQDLPALKAALNELSPDDESRTLIYYFGTARPDAYGISARSLKESLPEQLGEGDYLALSTNHLQGLYTHKKDPFAGFRAIPPLKRAGYSIFIYDLSTPEARQALAKALMHLRELQAE